MQLQEKGFDSGKANSDQGQSNTNQPSKPEPNTPQKNDPTGEINMWNNLLTEDEETARRREEGGRGTDHETFREELPVAMTNQFQNPDDRNNKIDRDEEEDAPNSELHS